MKFPSQLSNLLLLFAVCSITLHADDRFTSCSPADKFIEIKVTPKALAARQIWVLAEIPGPDQITLTPSDPVLRDRILELMQEIRDSGVIVGIGSGSAPQPGDPPQLEIQLADLDSIRPGLVVVLPIGLTSSPEARDLAHVMTAHICLNYAVSLLPQSLEFRISTAEGENSPVADIPEFTLAQAGPRFSGRPEGNIPVHLIYSQADLDDARSDPAIADGNAAKKRIHSELLSVAASGFDAAVREGLLDSEGKPLVDLNSGQTVAINVETRISKLYNLNGLDPKVRWGVVAARVGVRDNSTTAPWIVSVSGLQFAEAVDIEVIKNAVEMEFDGSEAEAKFDQKRRQVRDKLRSKYLANFSSKPGHILTSADIEKDQALLRADTDYVQSVGDITSGPEQVPRAQKLIYTVSRRLKAEKVVGLKLGGGYSPEEQITGNVVLDESNLLGLSENANLDYSGGPQVQRVRFTFARPFKTNDTVGWHIRSLGINVQYLDNNDTRFGNLTADEIALQEAGSTAQAAIAYDSFSLLDHAAADCLENKDRKRTRVFLNLTPGFSYRDVLIKEDDLLFTVSHIDPRLLPASKTQTTILLLDLVGGINHDFRQPGRSGAGQLFFTVDGRLQRGLRFFGADYDYNKIGFTFGAEFLFGFKTSRDFLLHYKRLMATSTFGTPVFELQRLGGPQTVRGLEEGEFIGRKMSADQFELGINLATLWSLMRHKATSDSILQSDCATKDEQKLPLDLRNAYLKFFYDQGMIRDSDSFVTGPVTRTAHGYGLAIELRQLGGQNVNLSLGYAYSPESALHRSGTLYTGVSYSF